MLNDCIAAVSTAMGTGGIGIVRVSGKDSSAVVGKVFKGKKGSALKSHSITYGHIEYNGKTIDECLLMYMKAPKTYTRDDMFEINCHGGMQSVQAVLEAVLQSGARLAEPGEFTKRAFLNGRIDLSQAEAVIDLINAKTDLSLRQAVRQLDGELSTVVKTMRDKILSMIAHIEAAIDYPENDIEELTNQKIATETAIIIEELDTLIVSFERGKIVREGIETVIVGKPNVGKSSLLNLLLKEERAIVTDIAGTTRDVLQEYVNIQGIPMKIVDTAGIRETSDAIEKIGVDKSKIYAKKADLILLLFDASHALSQEDMAILALAQEKKAIAIINKSDLGIRLDSSEIRRYIDENNIIEFSVKDKFGLENLYARLKNIVFQGDLHMESESLVANVRHRNILVRAKESLANVLLSVQDGMSADFFSIDLQQSYRFLGELIGESIGEDIVSKIFSEFCLGK